MKREWKLGIGIAVVVAMIMAPMVLADDISNNLDVTVDAVAEVMTLNVGGPNGTTTLRVVERNGDGKNGCNLTGGTTLVVSVSSSDPSVAVVSPSSATFTSCGATNTLTITPIAVGSATISLGLVTNTTSGAFNLAPATFTVNVAPPLNSAPTISVIGVTLGDSYNKGAVPVATCEVTDAEDGNSSFVAELSPITGPDADDGIGSQTASCSYTDGGGLTVEASVTYSIVDPSAPVIGYSLSPASPDGANGWYVSDVTLTWSVTDGESPNSIVKTGCDDQNIIADQPETTYSCSATSAGGSAEPVEVKIKRDATAPTDVVLSVIAGTSGTNGWYTSDVTVRTTGEDNISGPVSCTSDQQQTTETAGTDFNGTCTNDAGLSTDAAPLTIKLDKTGPSASLSSSGTLGNNGWYTGDVTISTTGTDAISSPVTCTDDQTQETDTSGSEFNGSCTNHAGLTTDADALIVKRDATAPTISGSRSPAANANGWNNGDVAVTFTCADATAGIGSCGPNQTVSSDGVGQTVNGTAVDNAGNTASTSVSGINIDKTDPLVSLVGGPADGGSYYFGSVPAAPTCSASDALSGLDGACTLSGYGTTVGTHTVTASAMDKAGNSASTNANYTVLAWTLNGFYQPVDMNGVYNVVRGGSTVPLKFEVFAGSTELTSTSAVKSFVVISVGCSNGAPTDDVEFTTTGGTSLRYDATGGQFIQNWQTPRSPGACYRVTMTTLDGSSLVAFFKLK